MATKETGMFERIGWNSVAQVADDSGGVIGGTAITAGQEVIYSAIMRRFMKGMNRSWIELILFSLVTAGTDAGLGSWMEPKQASQTATWTETGKEVARPLLSVLLVNYLLKVASLGLHNPVKSFGFKELLVQLAAKEMAYIGNGLLSKNFDAAAKHIRRFEDLQTRQHFVSRMRSKN